MKVKHTVLKMQKSYQQNLLRLRSRILMQSSISFLFIRCLTFLSLILLLFAGQVAVIRHTKLGASIQFLFANLGIPWSHFVRLFIGEVMLTFGLVAALLTDRWFFHNGIAFSKAASIKVVVLSIIGGFSASVTMNWLLIILLVAVGEHSRDIVLYWNAVYVPIAIYYLLLAIFEETTFRGYLYTLIQKRCGTGAAMAISTVLFALMHLVNCSRGASLYILTTTIMFPLVMGLILASAYALTKRLWMPIGLHWGWDYACQIRFGRFEIEPVFRTHYSMRSSDMVSLLVLGITSVLLLYFVKQQKQ